MHRISLLKGPQSHPHPHPAPVALSDPLPHRLERSLRVGAVAAHPGEMVFGLRPNSSLTLALAVGLSGLSAGLLIERLLVGFPVRAHAWVVGQVPSRGCVRGN